LLVMPAEERRLRLRRDDRCVGCSRKLAAGELGSWDPAPREVRCLDCAAASGDESASQDPSALSSDAGASARREYERRRDRRVPGTRANIDHIAIGPAGIFVIDAKRYSGRIELQRRGGLFSARTEHLVVAGRDRTKLIDAVERQVHVVRAALDPADEDVPVTGVLCFVDGHWPLFGSIKLREVPVVPPHVLAKVCAARGPLQSDRVIDVPNGGSRRAVIVSAVPRPADAAVSTATARSSLGPTCSFTGRSSQSRPQRWRDDAV
jgi:hypothetical protein